MRVTPPTQEGESFGCPITEPAKKMRPRPREIQDQACPTERAGDESGGLLELDLTAALRAGKLHGVGGEITSPQFVQNFVPGGTTVLQRAQASVALTFRPQAGQKLAWAVTFFPQCGHLLATTIWCLHEGQNRAVSGTLP